MLCNPGFWRQSLLGALYDTKSNLRKKIRYGPNGKPTHVLAFERVQPHSIHVKSRDGDYGFKDLGEHTFDAALLAKNPDTFMQGTLQVNEARKANWLEKAFGKKEGTSKVQKTVTYFPINHQSARAYDTRANAPMDQFPPPPGFTVLGDCGSSPSLLRRKFNRHLGLGVWALRRVLNSGGLLLDVVSMTPRPSTLRVHVCPPVVAAAIQFKHTQAGLVFLRTFLRSSSQMCLCSLSFGGQKSRVLLQINRWHWDAWNWVITVRRWKGEELEFESKEATSMK